MKTELLIFTILAVVVSVFLNADTTAESKDALAAAKIRIEKAGKSYVQTQQIKTIATTKANNKPNEG